MNKTIETMMSEHRLIVRVLAALDALANQLEQNAPVPREDVARFSTFFREFADKLHHGKEEDRLFVKMNECGFPREYGPVGVMLAEHTAGRAHVRVLADIADKSGPLSAGEREQLREHARAYVPLLLGHIQKEDNILYPMAQQAIPPLEFTKLDADCEAFEQQVMPPGDKQRLEDLAVELIGAYPPDPARMAAAMSCTGCPGHA
ncbi:MAG: hemerythrin domain-containing protein [Verrucomicrobia bacterium]|nr:hemerythrin domain-containing protein [Verrucomicrobiota bacterium]